MFFYNQNKLLGVRIDSRSLSTLVDEAIDAINYKNKVLFSCANPHSLVTAQKDNDFLNALNYSDQVVSDGFGTTVILKILGQNVPRITGYDYFNALMNRVNQGEIKCRVFFFGSSSGVLSLIENKLIKLFPNVQIVGTYSPPYGQWSDEENDSMIKAINLSKPDILWVGMTAPKQEKWMSRNAAKLDVSVIGSIGAVFDFVAGTYPRAPAWLCKAGLEWLYRLYKEPRRMWRRNFVSTPIFLLMVFKRHILNWK